MDHYGVIGHPISHSLSPQIHRQFAVQTRQPMTYEAVDVEPALLTDFVQQTPLVGLNVTLPHKQAMALLMDQLTERATAAGAVNTVIRTDEGRLLGDNTDGPGLVADLTHRLHLPLENQRLLLLGAGGAARGIVHPLMALNPAQLVIANRTEDRARELADQAGAAAVSWDQLADAGRFDGIVHSTAAGHQNMPELPHSLADDGTWCYDLSYGSAAAPFLSWARARGSRAQDGLGMLVEQAALSFSLWRGVRPQTEPVLQELRDSGNQLVFT